MAHGPRHRREPLPRRAAISSFSAAMQSASEPCGRFTGNRQDWQVGWGSVSRRPLRVSARRSSSAVRCSNAVLPGTNSSPRPYPGDPSKPHAAWWFTQSRSLAKDEVDFCVDRSLGHCLTASTPDVNEESEAAWATEVTGASRSSMVERSKNNSLGGGPPPTRLRADASVRGRGSSARCRRQQRVSSPNRTYEQDRGRRY